MTPPPRPTRRSPGTGDPLELLNAQEVGAWIGRHAETVKRMARNHEIECLRDGKLLRFPRYAVENWIRDHLSGD